MELHKFDYVRIKTAKEFNLWPDNTLTVGILKAKWIVIWANGLLF